MENSVFIRNHAYSQTSLRFGTGLYLWGSGDLLVPSGELEVRRDFGRWFSVGIEANFGHFSSIDQSDGISRFSYSLTTFACNQLLVFNLLDTDWMDLSLVGGSSIRYQHQLLLSPLLPQDPFTGEDGTFRSERYVLFGGHLRPEALIHFSSKDKVNVGISTSVYNQGEIFSSMSISYMRKI
ncbi:hypothetical protein [Portibacter marinus]|uniref:hypothetical protein n=1 Tax=Portibacter marinus TaxID=2898660 RepID=UPI001F30BABB|nr:hypothetical protein [Portibacter marinus]